MNTDKFDVRNPEVHPHVLDCLQAEAYGEDLRRSTASIYNNWLSMQEIDPEEKMNWFASITVVAVCAMVIIGLFYAMAMGITYGNPFIHKLSIIGCILLGIPFGLVIFSIFVAASFPVVGPFLAFCWVLIIFSKCLIYADNWLKSIYHF